VDSARFDIEGFRHAAPYINAHRGKTFVIAFGGEAVADARFPDLVHDLALLHSLGIRLVLVHGARPQIEHRLAQRNQTARCHRARRITDAAALAAVMEAVGCVRVEIEARLSMGLVNTPMAGMSLRVVSGNFVTARPLGVRDGIDFHYTGEVRKLDAEAIHHQLDAHNIALLSALGYSPTGETFNVSALEIAGSAAVALDADKLILLTESPPPDAASTRPRELNLTEAESLIASRSAPEDSFVRHLRQAISACRKGVRRAHLLDRQEDGTLLKELFTRNGSGLLISAGNYEDLRQARIDDVGGILELITPLEREGALVERSREQLELEIDRFLVIERDGMIIGCAALYPSPEDHIGELACLAVHPEYQGGGRGDALLRRIEARARELGLRRLAVLTTLTAHWFVERGFLPGELDDLPVRHQELYNYRRNSKVFFKTLP